MERKQRTIRSSQSCKGIGLHTGVETTIIFHPAPENLKGKIINTDGFYIIHYGKINPTYINGDKDKFYSKIEAASGRGTYEKCLARHIERRTSGTPILKNIKEELTVCDDDIICKSYDENKENIIHSFNNIINLFNLISLISNTFLSKFVSNLLSKTIIIIF